MSSLEKIDHQLLSLMEIRKEKRIPVVIRIKKEHKIKSSIHFPLIQPTLAINAIATSGIDTKLLEEKRSLEFVRHVTEDANSFSTDMFAGDIKEISELKFIERIEPVFLVTKTLNDAASLVNHPRIKNKSEYTGKGITVAVLDSGIDDSHPDMRVKRRIGDYPPDLRKKVVKHIDITGEGEFDGNGHGTHVAGIIASTGESSNGKYQGVAPDVDLINIKVLDEFGKGRSDDMTYGIIEAVKAKADVISMSIGVKHWKDPPWVWPDQFYYEFEEEAQRAVSSGILVCVAAGNEGARGEATITSPGRLEEVLTVGSTTKDNKISSFSGLGPIYFGPQVGPLTVDNATRKIIKPDVVATGGEVDSMAVVQKRCYFEPGIVSCLSSKGRSVRWFYWTYYDPCRVDGLYVKKSGTSMATPIVSGLGAMMIQKIREKGTTVSGLLGSFVKDQIMNTATDLGYREIEQGKGLVHFEDALASI